MRIQWASGLALLGLAVTACSGPAAPLDVGTQTVPIALVLGQLKAVDQAPVGPVSGAPIPESRPYYQPPAGLPVLPTSLPSAPSQPCPMYDQLAPVLGVGRAITAPPVKATYTYRGQVIEAYPDKTSTFVGDTSWSVAPGPVDPTTGAYDVVYTVKVGKVVTTRTLRTLPRDIGAADGADPTDQTNANTTANSLLSTLGAPALPTSMPNPAGYGLAGIYLVSQTSSAGTAFTPTTPVALLQLRQLTGATDKTAQNASSITSVGVDPTHEAVMAFRSTVTNPTNKVNACGTKLESVQVSLTSPNSPDATPTAPVPLLDLGAAMYVEKDSSSAGTRPKANVLLFSEKLDFGLQWGGLVLQDVAGVLPAGLIPDGLQLDPQDPPTATPSGSPPGASDPTGTAVWAGTPILVWAIKHMILKQSSFTINDKPKLPKAQ